MKATTAEQKSESSHISSTDLLLPSPISTHHLKCTALCTCTYDPHRLEPPPVWSAVCHQIGEPLNSLAVPPQMLWSRGVDEVGLSNTGRCSNVRPGLVSLVILLPMYPTLPAICGAPPHFPLASRALSPTCTSASWIFLSASSGVPPQSTA